MGIIPSSDSRQLLSLQTYVRSLYSVQRGCAGEKKENEEEGEEREVMFLETSTFNLREIEKWADTQKENLKERKEERKLRLIKKECQLTVLNSLQKLSVKV